MKRKSLYKGRVTAEVNFPAQAIVEVEGAEDPADNGCQVAVKNVIPGQLIEFRLKKQAAGNLISVIERSPLETEEVCPDFGQCGGCVYQPMDYQAQLNMKAIQVKKLMAQSLKLIKNGENYSTEVPFEVEINEDDLAALPFEEIVASPFKEKYRNKMEYTFGDEFKDGPLALGMHKRNSRFDIVNTNKCRIVHEDFNIILSKVRNWAEDNNISFYHGGSGEGVLRHLVLRRSEASGDILVTLVTTTQESDSLDDRLKSFTECLSDVESQLSGKIAGILHTRNDNLADAVKNEGTSVLYGKEYIRESILGLEFNISPFSFFQTNSSGAERLYEKVREYAMECDVIGKKPVIFDLYSGTGTIAQLLAPVASKVVGVEIVEEAVEAARENAGLNGLGNCEFIADDVLNAIDGLKELPDLIILDPPRDGVNPKALGKILKYGVKNIVYISCKPTSLARDLAAFYQAGYEMKRMSCVDMFPGTAHVECIALIQRVKS
ncbi:MAG: 23S rRNA (uracil(1939)-C(5))-methyltransferase RlmD [Clostridiales bacterium]|nr:23S rRNA (uracil(1939)-C(5))-methyltransferase RlmD [Clostridiales bacterium]MDU1042321.1 23S rRNA (uracil(1939)-C(5))-methyltransferase RlmD [Clostridiales bacterium]